MDENIRAHHVLLQQARLDVGAALHLTNLFISALWLSGSHSVEHNVAIERLFF